MKYKHHFELPHISLSSPQMELSPVTVDEDELSKAISDDPINNDDAWELSERPDSTELTQFWNEVEADVANDPKWFKFDEE